MATPTATSNLLKGVPQQVPQLSQMGKQIITVKTSTTLAGTTASQPQIVTLVKTQQSAPVLLFV